MRKLRSFSSLAGFFQAVSFFSFMSCSMQARIETQITESKLAPGAAGSPVPSLFNPSTSPNNNSTPTIRVTNVEAGQTVKIYLDSTCTILAGSVSSTGSTADVVVIFLVDGIYTFYAKATTATGATACSSTYVNYVLDTVNPSAPTPLTRQSPTTAAGFDTTPTITVGGVSNGDTVRLFSDASCSTLVGSAVSTGATADVTVSSAMVDGTYTFYATTTDAAGNPSTCSTANVSYEVDTVAPTAPTSISTTVSPYYDEGPYMTVGGLTVGGSVNLYNDPTCSTGLLGTKAIVTSVQDSFWLNALPAEGVYTIYGTATDAAGNVSPCSTAFTTYDYFELTTLTFANYYYQQTEGGSSINVQVVMSVAKSYNVQVDLDTSGSTAVSGTHFSLGSSSLTIPAGQTTGDITVSFPTNGLADGLKFLQLNIIGTDKGYRVIPSSQNVARVYIEDIDSANNAHILKFSGGYNSGGSNKERTRVCAINAVNKLYCWGESANDTFYPPRVRVGDGTTTNRQVPTLIDGANDFSDVQVGAYSVCGLTTAGYLRCWGTNPGDGSASSNAPVSVDGATTYSKVFIVQADYEGIQRSCAITTANKLKCWGNETGDTTATFRTTPVAVDAASDYSAVVLGRSSSCGLTTTGVFKCWGAYPGNGASASVLTPYTVDAGTSYSKIAVDTDGSGHCGITTGGALKCWGLYFAGDGTTGAKTSPTLLDSSTSYVDVSVASDAACAITSTGQLKCWGSDLSCGAGCATGTWNDLLTPFVVDNTNLYTKVKMIDLSYMNSWAFIGCALTTTGKMKCWGQGEFGNLGNGGFGGGSLGPLLGISSVVQDFGFAGESTFALTTDGALLSWGKNQVGQLGTGRAGSIPSAVDPATTYTKIAFQQDWDGSQMGLTNTGDLKCWGRCVSAYYDFSPQVPVRFDSGYSFLSDYATCGITTTGVLKCWGLKVGDGTSSYRITPTIVDSGTTYSAVYDSTSGVKKCAITTTGALKCWGTMTGDGTNTERLSPVLVDSGTSYSKVAVSSITCGITTANELKCWGINSSGTVGTGTYVDALTPAVIDSGTTYSDVFTTGTRTCARKTGGTIKCWGTNYPGNGSATGSLTPIDIDGAYSYNWMYLNGILTCGVTSTNVYRCWGSNGMPMGTGNTLPYPSPTTIDGGTTYKSTPYALEMRTSYGCGVTNAGGMKCWGSYDSSWYPGTSLGTGIYMNSTSPAATAIDSGVTYQSVRIGYHDSSDGNVICGLTTAGKLRCWGTDHNRVGDIDPKHVPAQRVIGL